jgi:single-strand DNA-binding protein
MSVNINKVLIAGNLTRDVETRQAGQSTVGKFGVATNERYKTKEGEWRAIATFVDVEAWGKTAELCQQFLSKGSNVLIEGSLQLSAWEDKEGQKRSKLFVKAEKVTFLDQKPKSDGVQDELPVDAPMRKATKEDLIDAGYEEPPF